jgi:RNA polymerase sigma-70 factor (ECF subfamily)
MPDRMRQAFDMHRFQGMKLVEIAARLSISKSTAQELVVDGVERCRRALKNNRSSI